MWSAFTMFVYKPLNKNSEHWVHPMCWSRHLDKPTVTHAEANSGTCWGQQWHMLIYILIGQQLHVLRPTTTHAEANSYSCWGQHIYWDQQPHMLKPTVSHAEANSYIYWGQPWHMLRPTVTRIETNSDTLRPAVTRVYLKSILIYSVKIIILQYYFCNM